MDPGFIKVFGRALHNVKKVFLADDGVPFVVSGSGSLGWDMLGLNVLEEGDEVLVVSQGYFGDAWAEWFTNNGAKVTKIKAPEPGTFPDLAQIKALDLKRFKVATMTHVDTSTAVRAPVQELSALLRAGNPNLIIGVDGVAATGGETLRMKDWDIDFVMTGSQKVLSVPAGLSICVARPRALAAAENRGGPVRATYVCWKKWAPIMHNYMAEKGSYFATPAVSLVFALDQALEIYLAAGGTEQRFKDHALVADAFRAAVAAWGLRTVCATKEHSANTLTAVYYPEGVDGGKFLGDAKANNGVILAGGLPPIAAKYFRVGHMGHSVYQCRKEHVGHAVDSIESALNAQGKKIAVGTGRKAFESVLQKSNL